MTDAKAFDLEMAAELADMLALEHVDPERELEHPADWNVGDDGCVEVTRDETLGTVERVRPRWRVDSDERADYALRRVAMCDEETARVEAFYRQQLEQLNGWRAGRVEAIARDRAFFHGSAADYGRRLREADPKFRTLPLPCGGKVTAHDTRAGVDVDDEEAFCTWALQQGHDNVVRVTMEAAKAEIPKRYGIANGRYVCGDGDDGEIVPGVRPRPKGWKADATPPKV